VSGAVAIVVAAGSGERLGADRPKAFVVLAGRPMVEWSIVALRSVVHHVVVALPEGFDAPEGTTGATGAATRSGSVRSALAAAPPGDPILVHDAARPLVTGDLARRCLEALVGVDGAIAAAPMTDTVKEAGDDGLVCATLDRSRLWVVQTPQVFRREALERALDVPDADLEAATDDAWLVERGGGRVRVVPSSAGNLKVTTPRDLRIAEDALRERC